MPTDLSVEDVKRGPVTIAFDEEGVLLCDVDGTLADIVHRRRHLEKTPKDWKRFKAELHLDTPIDHVIDAVRHLKDAGWTIVPMWRRLNIDCVQVAHGDF